MHTRSSNLLGPNIFCKFCLFKKRSKVVCSINTLYSEGGSRNGRKRGEQTTNQNDDGWCRAVSKRRQINKGERAGLEQTTDHNGGGWYQVIGKRGQIKKRDTGEKGTNKCKSAARPSCKTQCVLRSATPPLQDIMYLAPRLSCKTFNQPNNPSTNQAFNQPRCRLSCASVFTILSDVTNRLGRNENRF